MDKTKVTGLTPVTIVEKIAEFRQPHDLVVKCYLFDPQPGGNIPPFQPGEIELIISFFFHLFSKVFFPSAEELSEEINFDPPL
jgi:hypothetical protein